MVELQFCKLRVKGSIPFSGSIFQAHSPRCLLTMQTSGGNSFVQIEIIEGPASLRRLPVGVRESWSRGRPVSVQTGANGQGSDLSLHLLNLLFPVSAPIIRALGSKPARSPHAETP